MSRFSRFFLLAAFAAALCVTPALGAAPAVSPQLDLTSVAGSPFPSDRWTVPDGTQLTGLRVNLPKPDCAVRVSDCQDIDVLNRLDGFNLQPRLSIPFSGAIDVTSVSSSDVFLVRLNANGDGNGDQQGATVVGIDQIVWDPAGNVLHAESDQLLDQDATYALIVTTGVRDASGLPIDSTGFERTLNLETKDKALRAYREQVRDAMREVRHALGIDNHQIAAASVFTTQSATAVIEKIRHQLDSAGPSQARFDLGPAGTRTVFSFPTVTSVVFGRQFSVAGPLSNTTVPTAALNLNPGSVGTLAFGSFQSPNYETAGAVIPQVGTSTGSPAVQSTKTVAFNLIVPSGPTPAGGWPVAIFGHGFGDNKNNSPFVVASTLARQGIATIAINVVGHGFGPNGTLTVNRAAPATPVTFTAGGRAVDQNGSGTFDSTEGVSALAPNTIVATRDGLNQTVIDLMALVRTLRAGVDVDGNGAADLSTSRIYYYGQSFGGIYGTQLLAADPLVRAGVPNVPGGAIIEIARLSPNFRPLVQFSLATRVPQLLNGGVNGFTESIPLKGEAPITAPAAGSMPIQEVIDNTEWVSQTSNPVAWAPHLRLSPLAGVPAKPVIIQFARGDKTVPNPTTTAIIRAGDLADRTTLFRNDLAFAVNPATPRNPHTFLTNIAVPSVAAFAIAGQDQIAQFFASGGLMVIDPDGPGPFFETPIQIPLPEDLAYIP